jgi:hypothetical protein
MSKWKSCSEGVVGRSQSRIDLSDLMNDWAGVRRSGAFIPAGVTRVGSGLNTGVRIAFRRRGAVINRVKL